MGWAAWCKPFRKSKVRATRMMKTRSQVSGSTGRASGSGALNDDVAEDVRVVLAGVAGLLQPVVDLLPFQDLDRVPSARPKEAGDHGPVEGVPLVFKLRDAHDGRMHLSFVVQFQAHAGGARD